MPGLALRKCAAAGQSVQLASQFFLFVSVCHRRTLQDRRLDTAWAKPGGANLPQEGGQGLMSSFTRCVPAQRKLNSITTCRRLQLIERAEGA